MADRLALTEERMHSHAGRETRNVLENLPRDLLLEQSAETIAGLVTDIVGLQERRLVRVFEVPDPVGPWATVLVYLPKARFTAELPEKVADVVADAYGAEERTFEPYLGGQHAGPHRRLRAPALRAASGPTSACSSGPSTRSRRRGPTTSSGR